MPIGSLNEDCVNVCADESVGGYCVLKAHKSELGFLEVGLHSTYSLCVTANIPWSPVSVRVEPVHMDINRSTTRPCSCTTALAEVPIDRGFERLVY